MPIIWRYVIHIDLIRWSLLSNIQKRGRTNHRGFGENDHIPGASGRRNGVPFWKRWIDSWSIESCMSSPCQAIKRSFHGILPLLSFLPPASHTISGIQHLISFTRCTSLVSSCERSSVPDSHPRFMSPSYNGMSKEKATNKSSKSCANGKGNGTSLPFQELAYHSRSWL